MNARIKTTAKNVVKSSIVKVIAFSIIGNLIQAAAFYAAKKLNDDGFALLNFGVYVMGLAGIITDAFSKWLLLTVSAVKYEDRFALIRHAIKSSLPTVFSIMFLLFAVVYIYSTPTHSEALIILLAAISILIGVISVFPQAIIISKEGFTFAGLLSLIPPVFRVLITALWLTNDNIAILYVGFIVSALITLALQFWYVSREKYWKESSKITKTDEMRNQLAVKGILINCIMQICIAAFFLADGVILKSLMPSQEYSIYVAYAYIYKFPLFITISMMIVLIGKDFSDGNRARILRTLLLSLSVIIATFGAFILFDTFTGSWLLNILGYSRYIVPGFTMIFGLSWLAHTCNYYFFAFLLKTKPKSKIVKLSILTYGIAYMTVLFTLSYDTFTMLRGSLIVGAVFMLYNVVYIWLKKS